jgi:hypothetical protein
MFVLSVFQEKHYLKIKLMPWSLGAKWAGIQKVKTGRIKDRITRNREM